ncbi:hypothetical protein AB0425_05725 [Actinosynnema sp. NPDC051121]|nr:hypothetical protein [Saccharothrix sp.]
MEYCARPWLLDEVDDWLAHDDQRVMLISGDAGTGKSAFCDWLREVRDTWSAVYSCSHRSASGSTDPRDFTNSLRTQLSARHERFARYVLRDTPVDITSQVDVGSSSGPVSGINIDLLLISSGTVEDLFATAVRQPVTALLAADPTARFTFVVDGVDEATEHPAPNILDLLVRHFPADRRVKTLITCRNDTSIIERISDRHPNLRHVNLSVGRAREAARADLVEYVRMVGRSSPDRLQQPVLDAVARKSGTNFLYARGLLNGYALQPDPADPSAAGDIDGLYTRLLRQLVHRFGADAPAAWVEDVMPVLGLLAVAKGPVPRATLARWASRPVHWITRRASWLSQVVSYDGERETYALTHNSVVDYLLGGPVDLGDGLEHRIDAGACHRLIVDSYLSATGAEVMDPYGYAHLASHVAQVVKHDAGQAREQCAKLAKLLTSDDYLRDLGALHPEPVQRTLPYTVTLEMFLQYGEHGLYESVLDFISTCPDPYVSSLLDSRLVRLGHHDPARAERLVHAYLASDVPSAWRAALRAGAGMGLEIAERTYSRIVTSGSPMVRRAAPYELYLRWATASNDEIGSLLMGLARRISPVRPARSLRLLALISNVTITSYVNACDDVEVLRRVSDLWEYILKKRLHARLLNRRLIERRVLSPTLAKHLAEDIFAAAFSADAEQSARFFSSANTDRESARTVIRFLDPDAPPWQHTPELVRLLSSEHMIFRVLAAQVVAIHSHRDFAASRDRLYELYAAGNWKSRFWQTMAYGVLLRDSPAEWDDIVNAFTLDLHGNGRLFPDDAERFLVDYPINLLPAALTAGKRGATSPVLDRIFARSTPVPDLAVESLGLTGMYYPHQALNLLSRGLRSGAIRPESTSRVANWMHPLHSRLLDAFFDEHGLSAIRGAAPVLADYHRATLALNWIGHFNNGVNEAVRHPRMRVGLLEPVYRHLIEQRSPAAFVRAYTMDVLTMLRQANYSMRRWAD